MLTARESRAVTGRLVLDGLAASTDARQLVDGWAKPGCRILWSEIEAKDVFIRDTILRVTICEGRAF